MILYSGSNRQLATGKIVISLFLKIFLVFLAVNARAQSKVTIYCLHGQGSDHRLFDSLQLDTSRYVIKKIDYGTPEDGSDMREFAISLLPLIDTTERFDLVGVSLGGMICVELSEVTHPEKTIIISSAESRNEFPLRYRFQKKFPIYKVVPGWFLVAGAKIAQPLFEPDRNRNKETFKAMLYAKDGVYLKKTTGLIIEWDRTESPKDICHIHGTRDHTLPVRRIREVDYLVKGGSHMMVLTRAGEISRIIMNELEKSLKE